MKTFTDNMGRAWSISINVDAVKRVKSLVGVDLLEAAEGKLLEKLANDPVVLCDVIYSLCKPQADAAKITDEDFGRSMAGDAIDLAATALLEELVDFFPSRRRGVLGKALAKLRHLESMVLQETERRLDGQEIDKAVEQALAESLKTFGKPSTSLPALPESTPAP